MTDQPNNAPNNPSPSMPDTLPDSTPPAGSGGDAPGKLPSGEVHWQHMPLSAAVVEDVFKTDQTFADLGLGESVIKGVEASGFKHPTRIQAMLIPAMLAGKDVLGQAKTGTGKTAAFGLPLLAMCVKDQPVTALVLVPTRELCIQVAREINELGRFTAIRAAAIYGGQRINEQVEKLKRGPQIIVSTPGRLMDMVERRYVSLANVRFAVLDEVDRMLDIGFRDDIRRIFSQCPPPGQRQTVFVSATLPAEVERLARTHSQNAEKLVAVTQGALTTALVKQMYLAVQPWDKRKLLLHLLKHEEPALTVVFCRMKKTVDDVATYLQGHGIDVHAMHGDMYQNKRNKVMQHLHSGQLSVLVASDLASRGIDVDGITHVINYDMPEDPEVYVHRIGRTARIGREGVAWSFVTPEQGPLLTAVELLINMEVPKLDYPDFVPSPPPAGRPVYTPPNHPTANVNAPAATAFNRYAASVAVPVPTVVDPSKFPGGVVPSKLPPKRMFGKVKSTEALKASINATLKGEPPAAGPSSGDAPTA